MLRRSRLGCFDQSRQGGSSATLALITHVPLLALLARGKSPSDTWSLLLCILRFRGRSHQTPFSRMACRPSWSTSHIVTTTDARARAPAKPTNGTSLWHRLQSGRCCRVSATITSRRERAISGAMTHVMRIISAPRKIFRMATSRNLAMLVFRIPWHWHRLSSS